MDYMETDEDVLMKLESLTPVSTPVEQLSSFNFPEAPRCGRTTSVSSIASSVSNFSTYNNDFNYATFASHYKLTEKFENLLLQTYQEYQTNPTTTPFNESNPGSGIVAIVSKDALSRALNNGIEIGIEINNYSLTIIRQKLIQLCRSNSISSQSSVPFGISRNNSVSSTNIQQHPSLNLNTRFDLFSNQSPVEFKTPTDGYFSFETPPTLSQQQFGNSLQPSFLQDAPPVLSSPQNGISLDIHEAALLNATGNRKRESLRLKRSGNKPTYN